MSVKQRPDGKWRARYRDDDGKEHAAHFATEREAKQWLRKEQVKLDDGRWVDPADGRTTYKEWSETHLNTADKRPTTLARDQTVNAKHLIPVLGRRQMAKIRPVHVRQVVTKMKETLAPRTVRTNYGVLRAIFNAAVEQECIAVTPCRGVQLPPKTKTPIRRLTADELACLAGEHPAEYRAAIYVAGVLGLRWSEVAGLRVGRIDFLRRTLEVAETCAEVDGKIMFDEPKTEASWRTLRVPDFLLTMLSAHLAVRGRPGPEELVFVAPEGGALRRSTFRTRVFTPAAKRAGLTEITFHSLRHTAAGLMIDAGVHIEAIKARLGHSSIRVTSDVYGGLLPTVDESVTAALEARFARVAAGTA